MCLLRMDQQRVRRSVPWAAGERLVVRVLAAPQKDLQMTVGVGQQLEVEGLCWEQRRQRVQTCVCKSRVCSDNQTSASLINSDRLAQLMGCQKPCATLPH